MSKINVNMGRVQTGLQKSINQLQDDNPDLFNHLNSSIEKVFDLMDNDGVNQWVDDTTKGSGLSGYPIIFFHYLTLVIMSFENNDKLIDILKDCMDNNLKVSSLLKNQGNGEV